MQLFHELMDDIRTFSQSQRTTGSFRKLRPADERSWPEAGPRDILLQSDTRIEMGSPRDASTAFLLWTNDLSRVQDGSISLLGPDINEAPADRMPFGRVVLVGGHDFDEENSYTRFREMDLARYDISLKGYMMRAVSQYLREWSRISNDAVDQGFSLSHLGSALINRLKTFDYVSAVEVLFVTSANSDVQALKVFGDRFHQYIQAMTRMTEDHDLDCTSCEFQAVCDEAAELRQMHRILKEKQAS